MLVLLILLTPLPARAGQSVDGAHSDVATSQGKTSATFVRQLPGLRHVFAMVRLDLETFFGDHVTAERMLGPETERNAALRELPPARRAQAAAMHPTAVARWAEFGRLVSAVVGQPGEPRHLVYSEVSAAYVADSPSPVPVDADVLSRDRTVLSMSMSGYRPNVITDVVTGRLTILVVKQAAKRRLLGHTDAELARYLDAHVVARAPVRPPVAAEPRMAPRAAATLVPPAPRVDQAMRERFDDAVVRHARQHGVDPALVRAVIRHESAWNSAARSHKGAIGLMQLMPDTARLLGVNPFDPEQNIVGGIRYLADLLALFDGNLDAVIVAYVAGPSYAQRWLRANMVLDDEVRAYLKNVKASYLRRSA